MMNIYRKNIKKIKSKKELKEFKAVFFFWLKSRKTNVSGIQG